MPSGNYKQNEDEETDEWELIAILRDDDNDPKKKKMMRRTIRSVAFAPTSSTLGVPILATASFDGSVIIWEHCPENKDGEDGVHDNSDNDTNNENDDDNFHNHYFEPIAQLEGHENEIKCLAWNAAGSLLATCGRDKSVWIWECYLPGTVGGMTSSTATFSSSSSSSVAIIDERRRGEGERGRSDRGDGEFECLAVLQGHDGDVKSIVFGPSHSQWGEGEEVLYSASYDNTIRVWAEESGEWYCGATLGRGGSGEHGLAVGAVHSSTVWCLGLTPGGVRLFSGSEDGSIAIWKMYTAAERRRLFPSNNGVAAATKATVSHTDGLWNCVGKLPDAHSTYAVLSIDCAPTRAGHGRVVSGGGDNCINIYREAECEDGGGNPDAPKFILEAAAIDAHDGDVNCVKWHPRDGTCLVSCGDDGAVRLWRYRRGTAT